MYILRDNTGETFLKSIEQNEINKTEKIQEALIFETEREGKILLEFLNIFADSYYDNDFELCKIMFEIIKKGE